MMSKILFSRSDKDIWFNAASEGPLPLSAKDALYDVIERKCLPYKLTLDFFTSVPIQLKKSIAALIGVSSKDVILGNSASYGLHLLANGILWEKGDEILLMENDFPTDILPWLALEKKGVIVKQIKTINPIISVEELENHMNQRTRLVCLPHVHSFSGYMLDIRKFSDICKKWDSLFIVNVSQSVGTRLIDVKEWNVDGVVCAGYKWLCAPYGTGFCWLDRGLRKQLDINHAYWVSLMSNKDLHSEGAIVYRDNDSARKYDVFGTSNFFNFVPFIECINMFLRIGLEEVLKFNEILNTKFIDNLDNNKYTFISPKEADQRSSLIVISYRDPSKNADLYRCLCNKGLHIALWKNKIRISAHIYNTEDDINLLVEALNKY